MRRPSLRVSSLLSGVLACCVCSAIEAQDADPAEKYGHLTADMVADEVILQYGLHDSILSITVIDCDAATEATVTLNDMFWEGLHCFRKKIKTADPDNFSVYGELMNLFLIEPVKDALNGKNRLIIIPDETFAEVPFEAFIASRKTDDDSASAVPHYLILDFEVVYRRHETMRVNRQVHSEPKSPDATGDRFAFIGFSPGFTQHPGVDDLPGSAEELTAIGALFRKSGLSSWLGQGIFSRKDNFKNMAHKGKIIHLATHYIHGADAPQDNGFLFFSSQENNSGRQAEEDILTIDEICNLEFRADLIVLNACASGIERIRPGSSRNTLPPLFLKAGANNILSTLWNVTDQITGSFMVEFYRMLLAGKSYSAALREVKLQMLRCSETSLPVLWAPYILTER